MRWLPVVVAFLIVVSPAMAKQPPVLDPVVQEFITRLSKQPELMNLDYLQYYIGRPANERTQRGRQHKDYYWYDAAGKLKYQLRQTEIAPGQVVESTFVQRLDDLDVPLSAVQSIWGGESRPFFDYRSHATVVYPTAPNTNLAFHCPRNTFRVEEANVHYRGPVLPKPSPADITVAKSHHMGKVTDLADSERWHETVPLLRHRLKEHPDDGEAHYLLARAYARMGHVNEAIAQYRQALATTEGVAGAVAASSPPQAGAPSGQSELLPEPGSAGDLRARCLAGLNELGVKSLSEDERRDLSGVRRDFKIIHGGQHMRAGGLDKVDKPGDNSSNKGSQSNTAKPPAGGKDADLKPAPL